MKVFFTPAINGEYDFTAQRRMKDMPDNKAYAIVEELCGQVGLDDLDRDGYVKIIARQPDDLKVTGYWTYQQDDL